MKEIKQEELNNVNGSFVGDVIDVSCPKCLKSFDGSKNIVKRGSGCDQKTYVKCPYCGYEW